MFLKILRSTWKLFKNLLFSVNLDRDHGKLSYKAFCYLNSVISSLVIDIGMYLVSGNLIIGYFLPEIL